MYPANIYVDNQGQGCVLDFLLANYIAVALHPSEAINAMGIGSRMYIVTIDMCLGGWV
jgi:hypothetical protein